ncbi:MAG: hypothetical protein EOP54_12925 [Sphingobacteriales bacterium]|nr:MAG: hypothetical protein EOP54_12925 [Sphingobacteriales bacterium]
MRIKLSAKEVESAFSKLQASIYFDNYDLILRGRIATYKKRLNANIRSFIEECQATNPFNRFIDKMDFSILPKKVEPKTTGFRSNYYTNTAPIIGNEISRPNIHCNFPVELHLIATIWLMRYGTYIDKMVPKTSYGNRLIIDKNTGNIEGRSLFKPYFKQFQNWWSLAIKATKTALEDKQSVTILNFDLKSFYHEVKFDFDRLEKALIQKFPKIQNDVIHIALKKIHISYRELLSTRNIKYCYS